MVEIVRTNDAGNHNGYQLTSIPQNMVPSILVLS